MIYISKGLSLELYYQEDKSAVKISAPLSYGIKLLHKITIAPAKIVEHNCIDNYTSDENILYILDKGYYKYSWYDDMSKNNIRFITRHPSNAVN